MVPHKALLPFLQGDKKTNQRLRDEECAAAGNKAIALQVSSSSRPKLSTAAAKGITVLRKRVLDIAVNANQYMNTCLEQPVMAALGCCQSNAISHH